MPLAPFLLLAFAAFSAPPDAEQEQFLKKAKVVASRPAPGGITNSKRVTLSDGELTHDAHVQRINRDKAREFSIDSMRKNFLDTWRGNVAAYRIDRLLGLGMVPVSVERRMGGISSAVTWWVDDVMMSGETLHKTGAEPPAIDRWRRQNDMMRIFDALISNPDRNTNNMLITQGWDLVLIDHTRAFRWNRELDQPHRVQRCDRRIYQALRRLDRAQLNTALGGLLTSFQVDALLARRTAIVGRLDDLIAAKGEHAILFDLRQDSEALTLNRPPPRPVEAVLPFAR
jgi:hypothetical protein